MLSDAVFLARLQFAFTISFHIIFPAFSIGLSAYIAVLLGLWLGTGDERYNSLARFWTKVFAVSFAMGVVSGIVLSYQFGTNWSRFSVVVGNVVGPLIGYEVLTAFFLEASFLGILLFGWNRVPPWLHFTAALIVAVGTVISAFWILSANSWMQHPTGHAMVDGVAHARDWWAVVFNPTFPLRLAHMLAAAYLTTAFVVLATGARMITHGRNEPNARTMVRMAVLMISIVAPAQLLIGDMHGKQTQRYQPAKLAAIEAHWDSTKPGALVLFAWPNAAAERNDYEIAIPHGASLIVMGDPHALFKGLKDFAPADRPPLLAPFFGFRLMVGIGLAMIAFGFLGAWSWWRGALFTPSWWLWTARHVWPAGFVAILAGWMVTEVGRQPWIATGILRTADAASPITAQQITASLFLFVCVYCAVFGTGIFYIHRLLVAGPALHEPPPDISGGGSATLGGNRPITAASGQAALKDGAGQ